MSILNKLGEANVFNICKGDDSDTFAIWESCDYYFKTTITKQELQQLIEELQALHDEE